MKKAFYFDGGTPSRNKLFGICEDQKDTKEKATQGVLMCHAFSEERQKSYRSTSLFAHELAEAGIPSMRFDYFGTGDSPGNLNQLSIDSMVDDTVAAYQEAKRQLGVDEIVLVGIRLGALIANRAACQLGSISRIAFWNPIVEGQRYYRDLIRTEAMIHLASIKNNQERADDTDSKKIEIDAELLAPKMIAQLKEFDLANETYCAEEYLITGIDSDKIEKKQLCKLGEQLNATNKKTVFWTDEQMEYWSSRSMYDAFYPNMTFSKTIEWLAT